MEKKALNAKEMSEVIENLAKEIERSVGLENLAIIGIKRRGDILAERLRGILQKKYKREIPIGFLDITLYRDDFSKIGANPVISETDIKFDINERKILLVDDVIFTGRTVRAALDAIIDFGRPSLIRLAVLIDRNHRELPIQPDFVGKVIETEKEEIVEVKVKEMDGKDEVVIEKK
ncbi:MAG: bifunctional pyr operon transcriptional regulator/uracil phosphoribosyltransferase PyrR [Candidatus Omnitrophota bacterium]|nr:MAG: bifunctional pyr operon transcriptional regulator/uracil phosphoribosyltransferase PyrR [Candidatus Omnitrophota bacterium]